MVDNYDRLKELIGIAADSTGKADEQFAKYADTMEYKLNQLATKWEEFRTSFIDEKDFKKLIDTITNLLDKALNLNSRITPWVVPFAVLFAKTFVSTIFEQFQASRNNFAQLGTLAASGAVGQGASWISPSAQINKAVEKQNQKVSQQERKIEQTIQHLEGNQRAITRYENRIKAARAYKNVIAPGVIEVSQAISSDQKIIPLKQFKQLQLNLKSLGFGEQEINDVFSKLEKSIRKITPEFTKAYREHFTKPLIEEFEGQKKTIEDLTRRKESYTNTAGILTNKKQSEEEELVKLQKEQERLQKLQKSGIGQALDQGLVQGTVQGLQQVGSAVGMMASMMVAGAEAIDTLKTGLTMLVMMGISNAINAISSIIPLLAAKRVATLADNAATTNANALQAANTTITQLQEKAEIKATAAKELAWKASEDEAFAEEAAAAAKELDTIQSELNTAEENKNALMTEKATIIKDQEAAASQRQAAAQALATAAAMAAIAVIAIAVVGITKYIIEKRKQIRAEEDATTSAGMAAKAQNNLEKSLNNVANEISKYKEKTEEAKDELDKLTEATDKYIKKIGQGYTEKNLTEEEVENWTTLQNEIAEIHPELINYYDEQGNAILDLSANWDEAIKKAREYYAINTKEEGLQTIKGTALEYGVSSLQKEALEEAQKNQKYLLNVVKGLQNLEAKTRGFSGILEAGFGGFQPDEEGNLIYYDAEDRVINISENTSKLNAGNALLDLKNLKKEERNSLFEILKIALQQADKNDNVGISNLDQITGYDQLADEINKRLKDTDFATNIWPKVLSSITDENISIWLSEAQKTKQESEQKINKTYKNILKNIAYSDEAFATADQNIQDLMLAHYQDRFNLEQFNYLYEQAGGKIGDSDYAEGMRNFIEKQFIGKNGFKNLVKYSSDEIQAYNNALEETNNNYERYKQLVEELGSDSQLVQDFYKKEQEYFEGRKENAELLIKGFLGADVQTKSMINDLGDITDTKNSPILEYFNELGAEAQEKFVEGYREYSAESSQVGQENANAYYKAYVDTLKKSKLNSAAQDLIVGYDFSEVSESTKANSRASFIRNVLGLDKSATEKEVGEIFDALIKSAEIYKIYTGDKNTEVVFESVKTQIDAVNEALESGESILQSLSQRKGSVINIDPKERKDIEKLIKQLTEVKDAPLDASLFTGLFGIENGQETFEVEKFLKILSEQTIDLGDEILRNNDLTEEQKNEIIQLINYTKLLKGEWQTVGTNISNASNAISAFTSAAKEQIDEGYLKSGTIKSLADAFKSMGLEDVYNKNNGFLNEKLQFDQKAAFDEIFKYMDNYEKTADFINASVEQKAQWFSLKRELNLVNRELETEASSTDKVADAWKDYANQADVVKEKQQSLNDKIDDYNKLLYGNENRKSGLDLLYNYNEAISSFNDEMSRSKDQLSDSQTTDEAINAFTRYSAATHNLLVEEKAKQEEIQRGLNEYGNMIQNGYASYTDQLTGRTIGINFGDYVKYDQATGKYFLNQTLLDRAKFNDEYKSLIEENVENYNKYADEYKKSQDNVLKAEKEFQEQRKEAIKSYANFESTIADALKSQYEEEVNNLKDKYDAMKEEDDDYVDALKEAIDKQRKLRDRESKFEDLAKKERKLSLISRDTSGANAIQQRQLEEEIQKDRQQMLDDAIDDIIDGIEKLSTEQEETREVEIELKEALLENTAYWNNLAQETGKQITSQEEFITLMTTISKDFTELTYVQQLEKIEEYKETFAAAAQYIAIQQMDNASQTGDFIKDTIETTGDEILTVMTNTTSALANEAVRAYDETKQKVSEDLEAAKKSIDDAKQALKEAIEKLEEYAKKARDLEYARDYSGNSDLSGQQYNEQQYKDLQQAALEGAGLNDQGNQGEIIPSTREEYYKQTRLRKAAEALGFDTSNFKYADKNNFIQAFQRNSNFNAEQVKTAIEILAPDDYDKIKGYYKIASPSVLPNLRQAFLTALSRYANGGLVNFTGPAWVDGTPDKPEAFLNPEDTKRIGEAAKILSNLPIFNSSGEATNTITNNSGDISIEINLNVDKLSSDLDVDEMLNRVKEEIVAVARPAGVNTILTQHP